MGYLHISNLYKDQTILMFRECYALEKVHGTSANVSFTTGTDGVKPELHFFSGGAKREQFLQIFNQNELLEKFKALGHYNVKVFGEAYGGKMQGMGHIYGETLNFIVFDVKIGDVWLKVPDAEDISLKLGLEFVPYVRTNTDLDNLDVMRNFPSIVAARRGCGTDKLREGIVLRPLIEVTLNNGERIIAKHKRQEFSERLSKRDTAVDSIKQEILIKAEAIALEFVTEMRLEHILDKLKSLKGKDLELSDTKNVIMAMIEDINREGKNEFLSSKDANRAIGNRTARLFREKIVSIKN